MFYYLKYIILILLLLYAAKFDITERKIPNKVTIPAFTLGIIGSWLNSGFSGVQFSLMGFLVGLAVFFIPFLLGGMGAGDVKLMAAVGSLLGWKLTVYSALLTALVGGIIAIGYTINNGYFNRMIGNFAYLIHLKVLNILYLITRNEKILTSYRDARTRIQKNEKMYIPYGVAIAIGTLLVLIGSNLKFPPFV
ncbi:A24 family peptidase [Youngiibacter multivorans]|uniref:Prepilin peptidase CpaA n=1 Tax=Youngiibacter multivorans TaxID=937251 RepID=A0ABS4G931_9CLOT|nr:prepilin peptidase [Youngiibacter multivorans]MBP1920795.1 prepilin peptidase CpaA [Youngiibacter multivorans]